MAGAAYYSRLGAALFVAAGLGLVIVRPGLPQATATKAAAMQPERALLARAACAPGGNVFAAGFAPLDDIVSVSPLGGVTAPGETLPAPFIRINTKAGEHALVRRETTAMAPARADVTAIERRIVRNEEGAAIAQRWTVHFRACENFAFYYDDLDVISEDLMRRAGGVAAMTELDGPDHAAVETAIRVKPGDVIGMGDGFDVGVIDRTLPPAELVRPERYRTDPYLEARFVDASPGLIAAISPDAGHARCPLDYLPAGVAGGWKALLGDAHGLRKAKGGDACRAALVDIAGAAQGAWFTDAAHNGRASKVSAVALAPDAVDPAREIFALHGRLKSLTPDMVGLAPHLDEAREAAAKDFITFERGPDSDLGGRINPAFAAVKPGAVVCYEDLRANFVGPRLNAVLLVALDSDAAGADRLRIEARGDASSCLDLEEPWAFSGAETVFYR